MPRSLPTAAACVLLAVAPASAVAAGPGDTLFISGPAGLAPPTPDLFAWNAHGEPEADDDISIAGITQNGSKVAFVSDADDLASVPGDRRVTQIYIRDTASGALTSVTSGANGPSTWPSLSDDGTRIAFASRATNLSPSDTTRDADVFVKDLVSGTTTLLSSPGDDGESSMSAYGPRISGNGQFVVFSTRAPLDAGDTNANADIYRVPVAGGTAVLVSAVDGSANTEPASGASYTPTISDDGKIVAFLTSAQLVMQDASPVADVYVRKLDVNQTKRASAQSGSLNTANGTAQTPVLSGDGKYVAFSSSSSDLLPAQDSDTKNDVFRRQVSDGSANLVTTGASVLVSRATGAAGAKGDNDSYAGAISEDGAVVLFSSRATNLGGAGDTQPYVRNLTATSTTWLGAAAGGYVLGVAISPDAQLAVIRPSAALDPADPETTMYTRATAGGAPARLTARLGTTPAPPRFLDVAYEYFENSPQLLSADGRQLVFASAAPGLSGGILSYTPRRVFRRDLRTGELVTVSHNAAGEPARGQRPSMSSDARRVAFVSTDALVADDGDTLTDAYVADLSSGTVTLVSRGGAGDVKADGSTGYVQISADGTKALFVVNASNLGAPGKRQAYVRDLAANTTTLASRADGADGAPGAQNVEDASISGDGARVAFATTSANLLDGDADGIQDVHLRDLAAGATTLLSRQDGAGPKGTFSSFMPLISADGTKVAFRSAAPQLDTTVGVLAPGTDSQGYVRDLVAGTTRLISRAPGDGAPSNTSVGPLALSADGARLAYEIRPGEEVSNVAPTAPQYASAIVVRDLAAGTQQVVTVTPPDVTETSIHVGATSPSLSADGRCMNFAARGFDFFPGVGPDYWQGYVRVLAGDCGTTVPTGPPPPVPPVGVDPGPVQQLPAPPSITSFSLTNVRFRVGSRATAISARAKVGTTFRYVLTRAAASVTLTIEQRSRGRRVGQTCRRATAKLRKRPACTRYVKVGQLKRTKRPAGRSSLKFSGRVGRRALKPARYRATLVASDALGRKSAPARAGFAIVRR